MYVSEILAFARGLLGDNRAPYLWSQDELLLYYNRSVDDVCRRVKHVRDSSTASVCQVAITSGTPTYSYHPKIVEIISARLASQVSPLAVRDEYWMDRNIWSWKTVVGTPSVIIPEIEQNKFRLYPNPTANDTLHLSVARLPLTWVTIGQILTSTPPMDEDFHFDLIHGILDKAYLKDGTETYDPTQGAKHKGSFEVMIGKMKRERIGKLYFEQTIGPHRGAI